MVFAAIAWFVPATASAQWAPNGVPVSAVNDNQHTPVAVTDGAGGAFLAWLDSRGPYGRQIYAQRLDAAGYPQWTANGIPIRAQSGTNWNLGAVADGQGGAILAWYTAPGAHDHIFAQRVDASGNALWAPGGMAVCDTACHQLDPVLVADGAGGAIIAWKDRRAGYDGDIYAQRVNAAGEIQWDPKGVPICRAPQEQVHLAIAASGDGGAIVAWEDHRDGSLYKLYAQRVDGNGVVQWALDGVPVCTAAGGQYDPAMVPDGANGAVLTWTDGRLPGALLLEAQRLSDAGIALWDPEGISVGAPLGYASNPCALSDGAGGAFIAWSQQVGGVNFVEVQRVSAIGGLRFDPGRRLTNASGSENDPLIASDGLGGAIVAWRDTRANYVADIYAQRVSASGLIQWEAGGRAICTAPQPQQFAAIAPGASGSAIVAWSDFRSGSHYDLYAGTPDSTSVVSVDRESPMSARIRSLHPNPTRAGVTLELELATGQDVTIDVFDVTGRVVRHLAGARPFAPGFHTVSWDGTGERGARVSPGLYGIRVVGSGFPLVRRVAIVR